MTNPARSEPMRLSDVLIAVAPPGVCPAMDLPHQLLGASERLSWAPERRASRREPLPDWLRIAVLRRDQFRCRWCGAGTKQDLLQVDHIVPWSAGGSDHPVNLRALCLACNQDRSNRLTDASYARPMLPIVEDCQLCCWNADSCDLAIMAFCLYCNRFAPSPYELLGGPIPAAGVPSPPLGAEQVRAAEEAQGRAESGPESRGDDQASGRKVYVRRSARDRARVPA